jgi:hypothetical protein
MNLQDAKDRLYSGAPEDFVAARAQLAAGSRAAGDRDTAAGIAALRRPTAAAGLLNLLAREYPDAVSALRSIGDELRAAQRAGDGDAIRALGATRRQLIATTMNTVAALAHDRGRAPGAAVRAEVESSLAAAVLDPASAEALASGALTGALDQVGFGTWSPADGPDAGPLPRRTALRAVPDLANPTAANPAAANPAAAKRAEEATAQLEAAHDRAAAAQLRLNRLHEQIEQLRAELTEAATTVRQAREAERTAARVAAAAMRRLAPDAQ